MMGKSKPTDDDVVHFIETKLINPIVERMYSIERKAGRLPPVPTNLTAKYWHCHNPKHQHRWKWGAWICGQLERIGNRYKNHETGYWFFYPVYLRISLRIWTPNPRNSIYSVTSLPKSPYHVSIIQRIKYTPLCKKQDINAQIRRVICVSLLRFLHWNAYFAYLSQNILRILRLCWECHNRTRC